MACVCGLLQYDEWLRFVDVADAILLRAGVVKRGGSPKRAVRAWQTQEYERAPRDPTLEQEAILTHKRFMREIAPDMAKVLSLGEAPHTVDASPAWWGWSSYFKYVAESWDGGRRAVRQTGAAGGPSKLDPAGRTGLVTETDPVSRMRVDRSPDLAGRTERVGSSNGGEIEPEKHQHQRAPDAAVGKDNEGAVRLEGAW